MNATPPSQEEHTQPRETSPTGGRVRQWLRRLGLVGFVFFTAKGLLWLIVPYLIAKRFFSGEQ